MMGDKHISSPRANEPDVENPRARRTSALPPRRPPRKKEDDLARSSSTADLVEPAGAERKGKLAVDLQKVEDFIRDMQDAAAGTNGKQVADAKQIEATAFKQMAAAGFAQLKERARLGDQRNMIKFGSLETDAEQQRRTEMEEKKDAEEKKEKDATPARAEDMTGAEKKDKELENLRGQLDSMKMATIHGLAKTVARDDGSEAKVLYLTNKQALKFDFETTMDRLLQSMNITPPQLIVNVQGSISGMNKLNVKVDTNLYHKQYAELDALDLRDATRHLKTFIKDCVLKIAIENQALVIVNNTKCELSLAFNEVCGQYAREIGGNLPFTLLHIGSCAMVAGSCVHQGTTAKKLMEGVPEWLRSVHSGALKQCGLESPFIGDKSGSEDDWSDSDDDAYSDDDAERKKKAAGEMRRGSYNYANCYPETLESPDLLGACTHYILLEGMMKKGRGPKDWKEDRGDQPTWIWFKERFVKYIVGPLGVPNVGVVTGRPLIGAEGLASYVAAGQPLLILDSRKLPPSETGFEKDKKGNLVMPSDTDATKTINIIKGLNANALTEDQVKACVMDADRVEIIRNGDGDAVDIKYTKRSYDGEKDGRANYEYAESWEKARLDFLRFQLQLMCNGSTNWYNECSALAALHAVKRNVRFKEEEQMRMERKKTGKRNAPVIGKAPTSLDDSQTLFGFIQREEEEIKKRAEATKDGAVTKTNEEGVDHVDVALSLYDDICRWNRKTTAMWALAMIEHLQETLQTATVEGEQSDTDRETGRLPPENSLNRWLLELSVDINFHWASMTGTGLDELGSQIWQQLKTLFTLTIDDAAKAESAEAGTLVERAGVFKTTKYKVEQEIYMQTMQVHHEANKADIATLAKNISNMMEKFKPEYQHNAEQDVVDNDIVDDKYDSLKAMLKNKNLKSGQVSRIQDLKNTFKQMATMSRLPAQNSPEGMRILRNIWDAVDIYNESAKTSKLVSKLMTFLMLVVATLIAGVTLLNLNTDEANPKWWNISIDARRNWVMALSIATSVLTAIRAWLQPDKRWRVLRGAALELEAQVWRYRTRTGEYVVSKKDPVGKKAETKLRMNLEIIESSVKKEAGVATTSFFSRPVLFGGGKQANNAADGERKQPKNPGTFKHGQYDLELSDSSGSFGSSKNDDDHHKPIGPDEYIHMRVEPQVLFYQGQLPTDYRFRSTFEVLLILGSLSGTLMAFLDADQWTAGITTITTAIIAWMGYVQLDAKISRYSNVVARIKTETAWWGSLDQIGRSSLKNCQRLVETCENEFETEHVAWSAVKVDVENDKEAAETDNGGKEPDKPKASA